MVCERLPGQHRHRQSVAYHQTELSDGLKQGDPGENGGSAIGKIFGDLATKVHGVYGGSLGQWYR